GAVADEDRAASAVLPDGLSEVVLLDGERSLELDEFVVRWQQTTGPVMAKGVDDFHESALERLDRYPLEMLASQTHDTKRAGDVRARIGALAGMHEEWAVRVRRWRDLTGGMDDPNEEYLVWQTLVGAWPIVP